MSLEHVALRVRVRGSIKTMVLPLLVLLRLERRPIPAATAKRRTTQSQMLNHESFTTSARTATLSLDLQLLYNLSNFWCAKADAFRCCAFTFLNCFVELKLTLFLRLRPGPIRWTPRLESR